MSLPLELVDNVLQHLPDTDLATVAASSPVLCAVAQRILYRDLAINKHSLALTVTLAAKPHLARHVRALRVVIDPASNVLPAYYRALSKALSHMRELVSLSISIPTRHSSSSVLPSHPGLSYPRLRILQASFTLDQHLLGFLSKTPALLALTLGKGSHVHAAKIPPTCIPRLEAFSGSSQAAEALVPGRPVHSILLTSGDLDLGVVSALAQSAAPVLTLDATTTSLPLPILDTLVVAMPNLENIRLTTTYNLWDEFFNTPFIENIKNALMAMDHLKSANVSGMLWKWLTKDGRVLTNEPHPPLPPLSESTADDDDSQWTYDNHNTYYHH